MTNPTPKDELDNLLKAIYGKDVVDNAYASPAGKLTKAEAKKQINAYILGEKELAELYGRLHETIELFQHGAISSHRYSMRHAELTDQISEQRLKLKGDSK